MLSQATTTKTKRPSAAELLPRNSSKTCRKKWKCKLKQTLIGDYLAIPLTSEKMLKSESYVMNNCCRNYAAGCAALEYSVFSIRRRSGERLATLGLAYDGDYWRFDQCFGPSNTEVLEEIVVYLDDDGGLQTELFATELYYVAHEVARLMNSDSMV